MRSLVMLFLIFLSTCQATIPLVVNTWAFTQATEDGNFNLNVSSWKTETLNSIAWTQLQESNNSIDALVEGCRSCQNSQCDYTVGYGGSPDENGESTLDALIIDG